MMIFSLILAYLLGAIPAGLWIGKIFFKKDLHEHGSGNTGSTNTFRILGTKAGIIVFIFDFLKGTVATLIPTFFGIHGISPLFFGLLAVLGHTVSVFDKFHGGKAVATSAGVILGYSPLFLLYLAVVFLLILYLYSMISLSSISAAIAALVGLILFPAFHFILHEYDFIFSIIVATLAIIILVRHRSNVNRMKRHEESTVPFGLNWSKQYKKA